MDWFAFGITYAVMWWLVLFMVLPVGLRASESDNSNIGYQAAPLRPRIKRKLVMTTVIALFPSILLQAAIQSGLLSGIL